MFERVHVAAFSLLLVVACARPSEPPADTPVEPTGLWPTPGGAFVAVTGGNWDGRFDVGAVWWIDAGAVAAAVAAADDAGPCTSGEAGEPAVCDVRAFVREDLTRYVPTGAGIPDGREIGTATGLLRLYVPVRDPDGVVWIDLDRSRPGEVEVSCNADAGGRCGRDHLLATTPSGASLASDPVQVVVDPEQPLAYVPHLLDGTLTLLGLDPVSGPRVEDVESSFFREDPNGELELAGGFAVAVRPCDPEAPSLASRDCTRPTAVASHRYWPGIRNFSVAPGLGALLPGSDRPTLAFDPSLLPARPLTGGVAYVPGTAGTRLLVVSTTPPGLSEIDTGLDETGRPKDELRRTVPVCRNPNHLAVAYGPTGPAIAAVSCYADRQVALVALDTFDVVATVEVGAGPNHVVFDPDHGWLWVANTLDDSLTIIGADASQPGYLSAIARLVSP